MKQNKNKQKIVMKVKGEIKEESKKQKLKVITVNYFLSFFTIVWKKKEGRGKVDCH